MYLICSIIDFNSKLTLFWLSSAPLTYIRHSPLAGANNPVLQNKTTRCRQRLFRMNYIINSQRRLGVVIKYYKYNS
jgi:hypothetical protein